ncbi:hypothetical protein BDP27DRAFT_1370585 [Rhodocollybia butyracea]|uniref:Bacteriophage T5 Orf172 DNA-binding domain-containing protein n=1 Tax=Rhodocollybia butyracea TaxID=206335 RepID=A0A9P5P7P6_9AGAR|nr:hypothetical protein BDP27DRAFT_1370585 [Rhodocollybia butyracea]
MVRRGTNDLWDLISRRESRPVSKSDGKGYVYLLRERNVANNATIVKAGMTKNLKKRLAQHDQKCPQVIREVLWYRKVTCRRRTEALLHLHLEILSLDRPRNVCLTCGTRHIELFTFSASEIPRLVRRLKRMAF